jgi:hypothetical protein
MPVTAASITVCFDTHRLVRIAIPTVATGQSLRYEERMMRIGILGTGTLAGALGTSWARAGHDLVVGGRSRLKAQELAERLGGAARAGTPREAVTGRDAVLLAVLCEGAQDILASAGAAEGALDGTPLIDPTNDVEHGVGRAPRPTRRVGSAAHRGAGPRSTRRQGLPPVSRRTLDKP